MNQKLLILPGWGSNSRRWQKVKELLEEKGIEVEILDLPGFGVTPSPSEIWGRNDYINWIFQKLSEKNWTSTPPPRPSQPSAGPLFNLLGHSFGGGLAAKIAAENPNLVEKLILCAPSIVKRKRIKTYFFYWFAYLGKKVFSLPGIKKLQPQAQWLIYKLAGTKDYYLADGTMKEVMKKIGKEDDLLPSLEKIEIPTLILWGKKDDVLPLKDASRIKEKIGSSELKIISQARHNPHQETPGELAGIIIKFLKPDEL